MAEFPSLPVFTDAYLADTRHLTTEEHGAYLLLIMCAWRSPECRLVSDDKKLARMAGLSAAKWRKIKDTIAEFFTEKDGFLYQKKLTKIHKNVSKKVQQNQQNGKLGGRPKSLKNNDTGKANGYENENPDLTQSEPNQNQNQIDNDINISSSCDDGGDFQQKVIEAGGLQMVRCMADLYLINTWLEAGLTEDQIINDVARIRADKIAKDGQAPSSLRYYNSCFSRPKPPAKQTNAERLAAL